MVSASEIPKVIGLETEYGISIESQNPSFDHNTTSYGAYEVVSSVSKISAPLVDRGLEDFDLDEHEEAEAHAEQERIQPYEEDDYSSIRNTARERAREGAMRQRMGFTGFILGNGARYYVDMGHPEMSTPETLNPYDLVAAQKAGDLIVEECRQIAQDTMRIRAYDQDLKIHIHRNNSDGLGHSYAGHENYQMSIGLFDQIINCLHKGYDPIKKRHYRIYNESLMAQVVAKFFASRQIITGSGKVGGEEARDDVPYQISQRADFMMRIIGNSTVEWRGIINTRNQPLADHNTMRRFHVICGDSNMSELSIYLKCGITSLFLNMLEHGYVQRASGDLMIPLFDPVMAYHAISRDLALNEQLPLLNGRTTTALKTQIHYCQLAQTFVRDMGLAPVWHDIAQKWEAVLNGLCNDRAKDPWTRNLDWVVKEQLLQHFQKRHGASPTDLSSKSLALAYHDNNPDSSIYHRLFKTGKILSIIAPQDIERLRHDPPSDTRAWLRGQVIKRYPAYVADVGWDYIFFTNGQFVEMNDPLVGNKEQIAPLFEDNPTFEIFYQRIKPLFPSITRWSNDQHAKQFRPPRH